MPISERPRQTAKIHWSDPASTREWVMMGPTTRDDALAMLATVMPALDIVGGVARFFESIDLKEDAGVFSAVVHYGKNPNSVEINFDIGGGNTKATQSYATVSGYDCINGATNPLGSVMGVDFPDHGRAIGYNGTDCDGCDVELPKTEITINKKFKASTLAANYLISLVENAQTVNDDNYGFIFKGQEFIFVKGSLRFRGARIKQDSDDNLDITYNLLHQRGLYLEDAISIANSDFIEKEGHEYFWVYYEEVTTAGRKVKKPVAAYVEQVYRYANFAFLGF